MQRVRAARHTKPREQPSYPLDLVLIDAVTHLRIDHFRDLTVKRVEYAGGLMHAHERNMRIDIAASEEDGGCGELADVVAGCPLGSDQAPAQSYNPSIVARMLRGILEYQAGALRKAE